ncbi:MAG: protein kinase [Pirellulales bacterium]
MTQAHLHCSTPEQIQRFLRGELSSGDDESFQLHLDECTVCRELLSRTAADEASWLEAKVFFSSEAKREPSLDSKDTSTGTIDDRESIESLLKLLGPTDDPRMLGRIGQYEIVGVLGRGGMGVVFRAYEPSLNRYVAIKLLLPHLAASGAARMRFEREGKAAAAVIDDNVLPIFSVAEWQGVPYLVTQLSRGTNLQKRISESGPLELREILRLGMQTAGGLAAAHAQGLVHRDIKPSNILLDGTVERALLTDFGLARAVDDASITCSGIIAGTPQYMSPEQARGGVVDARSDLFGLGSVLYTMCAGRPPFRADNSFAVLRLITDAQPRPLREINPDIPVWLCAIIEKLMSKEPEDRYQSAGQVSQLLSDCLAHVQQPTAVELPNELRKSKERRRFLSRSGNNWWKTMTHYISVRMPSWLPCLLSTLFAFAVSLKPAFSLSTLPQSSFLHEVPPMLAVLVVTALGFVWGLAITSLLKRNGRAEQTADQPAILNPLALAAACGAIGFLVLALFWLRLPGNMADELADTKKQLLAARMAATSSQDPNDEAGQVLPAAKEALEIVGTLKNEQGEPIRNATVACSAVYDKAGIGGGASAITDAEGRYRLSGLNEGIYNVWLKHDENPHFTALVDDGIEVAAGQEARSELTLVRTNHVSGVLTIEGKPAQPETRILCHCKSRPESSATAITAFTDNEGRFAFDLPTGRAVFVVKGRVFPFDVQEQAVGAESPNQLAIEFPLQPSRFGSTEWLSRSTPGTEVLEQKKADDITGTIVDSDGNPVEQAKAFTEADPKIITSDNDGAFRYPIAKGTQTILRVFKPGYHIWFGTPTAGDRLKIVLEKKASRSTSEKTTVSKSESGEGKPLDRMAASSEQGNEALTFALDQVNSLVKDQPVLTKNELIAWASWNERDGERPQSVQDVLFALANEHRLLDRWKLDIQSTDEPVGDTTVKVFRILLVKEGSDDKLVVRERFMTTLKTVPSTEARNEDDGSVPLASAIARFNSDRNSAGGYKQPPLTEEEVAAAIQYEQSRRASHDVDDALFERFQNIAGTRTLPKGAVIEVIPTFETADGSTYTIWSVRVRLPKNAGEESGASYAFILREQFISVKHADAGEIHWGTPAVDGLQAGVRLSPPLKKYSTGQKVEVEIYYRNVLTKPLEASIPNFLHYDVDVRDAHGNKVKSQCIAEKIVAGARLERLVDGEQISRKSRALQFVSASKQAEPPATAQSDDATLVFVEAGETYRIRFAVPNCTSDSSDELTTGEIELGIRSKAEGSFKPAAQ